MDEAEASSGHRHTQLGVRRPQDFGLLLSEESTDSSTGVFTPLAMARDLPTLIAAPLVTILLPMVLLFCTLAVLLGGSGIRRVVLVAAGLGSLGALWLIAATKYVVGVGKGGVGAVLGPLLGWLINDAVKSWNSSPLGKQARITLPRAANIEFAILVAPFLLAVLLGAYALITIGIKLFRFNDCEEASVELSKVRHSLFFFFFFFTGLLSVYGREGGYTPPFFVFVLPLILTHTNNTMKPAVSFRMWRRLRRS
jgi:hypothetical protein